METFLTVFVIFLLLAFAVMFFYLLVHLKNQEKAIQEIFQKHREAEHAKKVDPDEVTKKDKKEKKDVTQEYEDSIDEEDKQNEGKKFSEKKFTDINLLMQDYVSSVLSGEEDIE